MKRYKTIPFIVLSISLALLLLSGCSGNKKAFSYSNGIDNNGFWKGVKALKHLELCDYLNISIPESVHNIPDQHIQDEIDIFLFQYASENHVTDRAIVDGDTVNIDFVGSIDGVEFEGGSADGEIVTIGATDYIEGFLEQLIGHSPGETFDIEVTFPENYLNEELSGKDAVFKITVNYIIETVLPELTDSFVQENLSDSDGWTTVAEMKEDIGDSLQHFAVSNYVQEYIFENTKITSIPKRIIEYLEDEIIFKVQSYADEYNMKLEDYLSTFLDVSTTDQLLENFSDSNKKTASFFLILQAIAEDAGLSVTDDDLAAYFMEFTGSDDYSHHEEYFGLPYIKMVVLQETVIKYLEDNAVLE